ncbi:MAG: NAD(P)/FAD-dependent oxidoreductase [Syntrophaceae bacterium]|nr:NAD(P)/FAD-dependent oxidoreductase [Syntrophaceae bacterium]
MGIVIVGSGPAGIHAALQCRESWPHKSVTLVEGENYAGYCRPLLPLYMAGQVKEEKLFLFKPGEDHRLQVKTGAKVQSLDRDRQTLRLENGEEIEYERLILAPGGRPIIPRLEGADGLRGVFPVRNLPDARSVRGWIAKEQKIVVLGGGLVGVKTAAYLRSGGFQVAVVEKENRLLPQALGEEPASYVENHFRSMGIDLFLGGSLEAAEGEGGKIARVKTGGQWIPCDTLLLAIGSAPNVSFLNGSGLLEEEKLRVSQALQTRDPRIFAAGDAVTIFTPGGRRFTPWTWPQAVSQGKLAAVNLYRAQPVPLKTLTRVNSMNLQGLSLTMLGAFEEGSEEVSYALPGEGIFRQIFLREGRIAGGALVGDITGAGPMHHFMIGGKDPAPEISRLIRPSFGFLPRGLSERGLERRRARVISGEGK